MLKFFFLVPLAFLFLKEKIGITSFFYIFIGFIGVILILGFEKSEQNLIKYYTYAILGTFLIAYIKIFLKHISKKEKNIKIQFYFSLNSTLILLLPYIFYSSKILFKDFFYIFLLSVFGLLAQYFTVEGLKKSEATKVMPFDYTRILFGSIIGVSFFTEKISPSMIFGSLIIIFAGIRLIKSNPHN